MYVGLAWIALLSLGIGLWLYWHQAAPKFTTLLFLIAGCGIGGLVGNLIQGAFHAASGAASSAAHWIGFTAGGVIGAACVVATLEIIIYGLWRRTAKPQRWHPWLALALPTIGLASGIPLLVTIFSTLTGAVTHAGAVLNQLNVG